MEFFCDADKTSFRRRSAPVVPERRGWLIPYQFEPD
jgi:hypothetical protein